MIFDDIWTQEMDREYLELSDKSSLTPEENKEWLRLDDILYSHAKEMSEKTKNPEYIYQKQLGNWRYRYGDGDGDGI